MQGDSSISVTQGTAGARAATAGTRPSTRPSIRPSTTVAGVLGGLLLMLIAGIATAAPAAAVDDPTRPDVRVTHGPSCAPGGLVVEVVAGTSPYVVRLATTREPGGEDEATVVPGTTVVLRTGDVDWGERIDGRLEFEARDGSGTTYVDELDAFSFTRPTSRDCSAVHDRTEPHPSPPPGAVRRDAGVQAIGRADADTGEDPSADRVAPGQTVTLDAAGFLGGEPVVVRLAGGAVLARVEAAVDGTVLAQVQIPETAAAGALAVTLVGEESAVALGVDLLVGRSSASGNGAAAGTVPLVAAAGVLVVAAAGLATAAGRQRPAPGRRRPPSGSA